MGNTATANAASDNIALRGEIFASFTNEFVPPQSGRCPETGALLPRSTAIGRRADGRAKRARCRNHVCAGGNQLLSSLAVDVLMAAFIAKEDQPSAAPQQNEFSRVRGGSITVLVCAST